MQVQLDINDVAQQYKTEFLASIARNVELAAALGASQRKVEALTKENEELKAKLPKEPEAAPQA